MRRRSGFTIVELLVAMALIMFIMAILSEAFVAALKSFRDLKASADMAERLRSVSTLLRKELAANHFDGQAKMSQPDFWANGPRAEGFFRVYQGSAPTNEGPDPTELGTAQSLRLLSSYRATDHMLHFAVKLRGNERGDFFSADLPTAPAALATAVQNLFNIPRSQQGSWHYEEGTNVFRSQWAEVAYFLRATGDNAQGTPLFALCRRQRLLVPDSGLIANAAGTPTVIQVPAGRTPQGQFLEMSCVAAGANNRSVYFNNPRDITMPIRRLGMAGLAGTLTGTDPNNNNVLTYPTMFDSADANIQQTYDGCDQLMSDVVSFEVRLLLGDGDHFESLYDITGAANGYRSGATAPIPPFPVNNTSFSTAGPLVFDTWSSGVTTATGLSGAHDYSGWATTGTASSIPIFQRNNGATTISVKAISVTIRVWDVKTEQTREIAVVQDM